MTGLDIVKKFEGCQLKAYPDPATGGKPYTIGYGCTFDEDGELWHLGDMITQDKAEALLIRDFNEAKEKLCQDNDIAKLPVECIDVLTSLVYNIGISAFMKSKCCAAIKAKDLKTMYANWDWISAAGKPMRGLAVRRATELAEFLEHWKI